MLDPEIVQVVIQGGAVGVLLVFGVGVYKLARRAMDLADAFVANHLRHLTDAIGLNTKAVRESVTVSARLLGWLRSQEK